MAGPVGGGGCFLETPLFGAPPATAPCSLRALALGTVMVTGTLYSRITSNNSGSGTTSIGFTGINICDESAPPSPPRTQPLLVLSDLFAVFGRVGKWTANCSSKKAAAVLRCRFWPFFAICTTKCVRRVGPLFFFLSSSSRGVPGLDASC